MDEPPRATRELLERANVAGEALLRQYIENVPAAVAMFDRDMRYVLVSARWITDYHLEGVEVIGRLHYDVFPDIPERWKEVHQRALAGARERCEEDPFLRADGTTEWLQWDVQPWRDAAGEVGGVIMFTQVVTARKRAEARLQESEQRFRALSDNSLVGIYVHQDLRITYVNPAIEQIFGYEPGELLGQHPHVVIHPLDRALAVEVTRRRLAGELDNVAHDVRGVRKDGTTIHIVVFAFLGEIGGQRCVIGNVVDVTERRLAEQRLRESEHRWRTLIEDAPVAIGMQRDGHPIYVNRKFRELWRFPSLEAALAVSIGAMWTAPFGEIVMERARQRPRDRAPASYEDLALRQDGTTFPAHVDVVTIELPDGPAGIAFFTDLTERKQAEAAIRDSEARFRQLAETIDQVFWIEEAADHRLVYVSPAFERIWGRPPSLDDVWPPAMHPEDRGQRGTYRIIRPDGDVRWIRDRSYEVRDERGELHRIVGAASDITAQESLERQLRHSQKMEAIGVLAGGVAHDFNNLLAVILSYTSLVLDELPAGDPRAVDLREVVHAADRATQMTKQLLAFSRQQVAQPRVVDLNDVLAGCEKMLRRLIGEHIELASSASPTPAMAFVDPGQMEQVLMNLVVNARDAMPDGGQLAIDLAVETLPVPDLVRGLDAGRHVLVSVSDTGVGMDEAIRARIFEPFFTTKEVGKGTGLGLSTVFGIVQQSGGQLDVESEVGRGTTFRIWLPFAAGERATAAARAGAPRARGAATILLVEDDDAVRRLVRAVLTRHGYAVLDCRSGGDALVISERHPGHIELLLTDVVMPLMSGDQLYERLRTQRPSMRVGFMSGYPDKADGTRPAVPPELFIPKPFTPDTLLHRIRELLA